jgi:hypothetical protein
MSYSKKQREADDKWRKKHYKGDIMGPAGYRQYYVDQVVNKYDKAIKKGEKKEAKITGAKPKAASAPPPAPVSDQPVIKLVGRLKPKPAQAQAPPAPPVRDASPKRTIKKRYVAHHAAPKDCMVRVSFMARKKGCKKE